jgi:hypothetical protein
MYEVSAPAVGYRHDDRTVQVTMGSADTLALALAHHVCWGY